MKLFKSPKLKLVAGVLQLIDDLGGFVLALFDYTIHKLDGVIWLLHFLTIRQIEFLLSLKFYAAARLIWSRGRRGKELRYALMSAFILGIFLIGGRFQDRFVRNVSYAQGDFLVASESILSENTQVATYVGESSLLDEPKEHVVEEGESLSSIGKKYGISVESIKFANDLTSSYVREGQVLQIPPVDGTLHEVKGGDTIASLSKKYRVPEQMIVDFNYLDAPYTLTTGQVLTIPDAALPTQTRYYVGRQTYSTSAYGVIPYVGEGIAGSGVFGWPFSGIISQGFSRYHPAVDIAANSGNIVAADKGTIVRAGWWQGGYGNAVRIDHGNGYVTTYAHMSVVAVSSGDEIEKGDKIGVVGSTGRSTGPHLHFTVQLNGQYLNPLEILQ